MNSITLNVELCAEDRARLDAILAALTANTNTQNAPTAEAQPAQEPEKVGAGETKPAEVEAPAAPAEPVTEPAPAITAEELQQKIKKLLQVQDKKAAVKDIVLSYAESVTKIPEDKRAEVWDKLIKLEG